MLMQASGDIAMLIAAARAQCRNVLSEPEAKAFLRAQGISVPPGRAVSHAEEAPAAVRELGVPVVVKAVAHQLTHKTDVGAVMFPVESPAAANAACRTSAARVAPHRPDLALARFLIEPYPRAQPDCRVALRSAP